jgi:hypothetical protein
VIASIKARGVTYANGIAKALNDSGIKTARGRLWTARTVQPEAIAILMRGRLTLVT